MSIAVRLFGALTKSDATVIGGIAVAIILTLSVSVVCFNYGMLWIQAYISGARVSLASLIGMSLRHVKPRMVVTARIMGRQAGLDIDRHRGMSTARLEAHFLAGGDVMRVLGAIIAAHRAGIELDFSRAAAIDLAGRDVLEAVRTSVSPKVIDCPAHSNGRNTLSAVAKNGVELLVRARVTVRTNLDQLIGGATEETIIARVGQGIVSAVGSAATHLEVLRKPNQISKCVLNGGLDANTAYEIVSIDVVEIDVGKNMGAILQADRADADMRMARARAEGRRAKAVATHQEMIAKLTDSHALLLLAESKVPAAIAQAFRRGRLYGRRRATPRLRSPDGVPRPQHLIAGPASTAIVKVPDSPSIDVWETDGGALSAAADEIRDDISQTEDPT